MDTHEDAYGITVGKQSIHFKILRESENNHSSLEETASDRRCVVFQQSEA